MKDGLLDIAELSMPWWGIKLATLSSVRIGARLNMHGHSYTWISNVYALSTIVLVHNDAQKVVTKH